MLQKIKTILPWILVVIFGFLLIRDSKCKKNSESTIDSLEVKIKTEESLIDSFYVLRDSVKASRDSMRISIDTLGIYNIRDILKTNIKEYEEMFNN